MAQPAYLSPRPSPNPLQQRRTASTKRASLFRPPQTPATPNQRTSSHGRSQPHYAAPTATSTGRKRARNSGDQAATAVIATPMSDLGSAWASPSIESSAVRSDFASPEPFVNMRYNLAGGLDTPGAAREDYFERSDPSFVQTRRCRDQYESGEGKAYPSSVNGSPAQQSWGQFVFAVAGKMWTFGSSAFKGFYAGGGRGYDMHEASESTPKGVSHVPDIYNTMHGSSYQFDRLSTPVPGSYPQDEEEISHDYRPAKRMHVDDPESPWIMVQNPLEDETPHRKRPLHRPPPYQRTSSGARRSLVPVSRRSSSYHNPTTFPAVQTSPNRGASFAQLKSSSDLSPVAKQSPLSPEAHKYLHNRRREEKQQDASIRRMNEQLQALLRQGREALGTKVEVLDCEDEMELEDEGYFDDAR